MLRSMKSFIQLVRHLRRWNGNNEGFESTGLFILLFDLLHFRRTSNGHRFVMKDHTAETRIYYALDLGTTYRLIDESMLETMGLTETELMESALFRVRSLPTAMKKDEVAGNIYYFINNNDGYDASRILNSSFLKEMEAKIEGHMTVSVPHQDVLIIGDIRNDTGYDVLAQMTMHFFTTGTVPVTSLSFIYEDGKLEPIFIMAKNRVARREGRKNEYILQRKWCWGCVACTTYDDTTESYYNRINRRCHVNSRRELQEN